MVCRKQTPLIAACLRSSLLSTACAERLFQISGMYRRWVDEIFICPLQVVDVVRTFRTSYSSAAVRYKGWSSEIQNHPSTNSKHPYPGIAIIKIHIHSEDWLFTTDKLNLQLSQSQNISSIHHARSTYYYG